MLDSVDYLLGIVRDAPKSAAGAAPAPAAAPNARPPVASTAAAAAPPPADPAPADKGPVGILDQIAAFINGLLK